MTNCNNANWMTFYASTAECMAVCAAFPVGTDNDVSGNTVGCRTYHAGASPTNYTYHCPHASAYGGGGVCGSYCDAYCSMGQFKCNSNTGYNLMGTVALNSAAACNAICGAFPVGPSLYTDTDGATLACRLYHAKAVLIYNDPALHCPHASPTGGQACGTFCQAYCQAVNYSCAANTPQFTSNAACDDYCTNNLDPQYRGNWNDSAGDTVGCRIYHADAAKGLNDQVHCVHAGPSGDDVCGTWCENYCDLMAVACTGSNSPYNDDRATCMSKCTTFATSGKPGDAAGNTVQCRIYHAGVAGVSTTSADITAHCGHAGPDGANVCVNPAPATTGSTASGVVASALLVVAMILAVVF